VPTPTNTPVPPTATPTPLPYATTILNDGTISYWRLGETSGTTAADSSTGGNPGTITGGVTLGVPGALTSDSNTAMSFNGSSGYISVPDKSNLDMTGDFTLEAWAKPTVVNDGIDHAIIAKGGTCGNSCFQYRLYQSRYNTWRGILYNGSTSNVIDSPGAPTAGVWTYLALTRSGSTVTLYVNGTAVKTMTLSPALNTSTGILALGRQGSGSADYFNGSIDEAAVYNKALSATQVLNHFNAR
jgi:hypothetical protein